MHTATVVLLPPDTTELWQAGIARFQPSGSDEASANRYWRLDYWTVGAGHIADEFTARALKVSDHEALRRNVCFVSRLPRAFVPGAIATPDGTWYDLAHYGWRFVDGDTSVNRDAEARWSQQVKQLFATYADHIAVEFDMHL